MFVRFGEDVDQLTPSTLFVDYMTVKCTSQCNLTVALPEL